MCTDATRLVEARGVHRELRPFLGVVCGDGLARVVATVLLVTEEVCGVPVPHDEIRSSIRVALDTGDKFRLKESVAAGLRTVLISCISGAARPFTDADKRLAKLLRDAVTLLVAYDPLGREGSKRILVLSAAPGNNGAEI